MQRIIAGLNKFSGQNFLTETGFNFANAGDKVRDTNAPLPTQTTRQQMALVMPGEGISAEDMLPYCGFRMLEPRELKLGMSFPDSYIILGNKRDQVKQVGNAVCPNVAAWIVARCVESLQ